MQVRVMKKKTLILSIPMEDGALFITPSKGKVEVTAFDLEVSDDYHTMSELYDHRRVLNAALFNYLHDIDVNIRGHVDVTFKPYIIKSKLHEDGTMFDGYFVVSMNGPDGQISYHYALEYWDQFKVTEVERVPWKYDGHTSKDVINRLLKL